MPNIGPMEIAIVLIIALVVFGPSKLPELGKSAGKGFREFKDSVIGQGRAHEGTARRADAHKHRLALHARQTSVSYPHRAATLTRTPPRRMSQAVASRRWPLQWSSGAVASSSCSTPGTRRPRMGRTSWLRGHESRIRRPISQNGLAFPIGSTSTFAAQPPEEQTSLPGLSARHQAERLARRQGSVVSRSRAYGELEVR